MRCIRQHIRHGSGQGGCGRHGGVRHGPMDRRCRPGWLGAARAARRTLHYSPQPATKPPSSATLYLGCAWSSSRAGWACACWGAALAWTHHQPGRNQIPAQDARVRWPVHSRCRHTAAVEASTTQRSSLAPLPASQPRQPPCRRPRCPGTAAPAGAACAACPAQRAHPSQEEVELRVGVGVAGHLEQRREDIGQQLRQAGGRRARGGVAAKLHAVPAGRQHQPASQATVPPSMQPHGHPGAAGQPARSSQ